MEETKVDRVKQMKTIQESCLEVLNEKIMTMAMLLQDMEL